MDTSFKQETQKVAELHKNPSKPPSNCPECAKHGSRKKHTSMYMFECECGQKFCSKHRYPELHQCTFDYQNDAYKEKKLKHWIDTKQVTTH
jgi:hypothetical protein